MCQWWQVSQCSLLVRVFEYLERLKMIDRALFFWNIQYEHLSLNIIGFTTHWYVSHISPPVHRVQDVSRAKLFWVVTPVSYKYWMLSGLTLSLGKDGKLMKPELSWLQQFAVSQHAICLSQVNIESYEHSRHTDTSLQNTLPTMPFSKHLCLWPNTLPCHLQLDFF